MKNATIWRHGDVVIEKTNDPVYGNAIPKADGFVVLADGKSTGHSHRICANVELYGVPNAEPGTRGILVIPKGIVAKICHDEHATRTLPPGRYKVRIKRKYDPDGGWSDVVD